MLWLTGPNAGVCEREAMAEAATTENDTECIAGAHYRAMGRWQGTPDAALQSGRGAPFDTRTLPEHRSSGKCIGHHHLTPAILYLIPSIVALKCQRLILFSRIFCLINDKIQSNKTQPISIY